jgi:hypothetical protein
MQGGAISQNCFSKPMALKRHSFAFNTAGIETILRTIYHTQITI